MMGSYGSSASFDEAYMKSHNFLVVRTLKHGRKTCFCFAQQRSNSESNLVHTFKFCMRSGFRCACIHSQRYATCKVLAGTAL